MKKIKISLLLAAVLVLISACSPSAAETDIPAAVSRPAGTTAEGRVLPLNSLDQAFSVPGQVSEVLVKDGDAVQAGQVLARLTDSAEARAALVRAWQEALLANQALDDLKSAAELNLATARQAVIDYQEAFDKAQDRYDADDSDKNKVYLDKASASLNHAQADLAQLESGNGIDPDLLEAVQARIETAKAALDSAQSFMDSRELKASMDGQVVDLELQAGQLVAAGQPVVLLADLSGWLVETDNLTELEVARVSVGQEVEVVLDALPDLSFTGTVTHISSRYVEKRGDITYTVTIQLENADPQVRWGMTAAVRFDQ